MTNFTYISTALAGLNEWTGDLVFLRRDIPRRLNAPLAAIDKELPDSARVLLVGQAAVFHLNHRVDYNTVFNEETIETLATGKTPEQLRRALRERQLTHIYVDWKEIQRHRQPGGYGFTDFVTPARFADWVAAGILDRPIKVGPEQELLPDPPDAGSEIQVINKVIMIEQGGCEKRMEGLTIVTGGAGFIGSHLVGRLVESGQPVRVVERPGAPIGHLPDGVDVVFADIRDRGAMVRALEGGRWVYHLAANPNLWVRDRDEFDAVNYRGTINVLDAALAAGAERVLHTSTESILTKARADEVPIDENVEVTESDTVGAYCRSKLLAEQYAFFLASEGLPVVVANPTMPVGPGDRGLSPPTRLILDFCRGRLPAMMDCTLNLIDVRDVAHGLFLVMERGTPGRRYLLGHANLTLASLLALLGELTGVPVPRWSVPYSVGIGRRLAE